MVSLTNEVNIGGETLWLLAYDVPSEHIKGLDADRRHWLNVTRRGIWYQLRYKFRCAPVQKSVWLIRDQKQREALEQEVARWKLLYEKRGFPNLTMQIFPIATNNVGYKTFQQWEFEFLLDWAGQVWEKLEKYSSSNPPTKRTLMDYKRRLGLIQDILNQDFHGYHRYNEANDILTLIQDKALQLVGFAK